MASVPQVRRGIETVLAARRRFRSAALLRRVLLNWGIVLSGGATSSLLTLAAVGVAARALTPSDFGVLVLIQTYVRIIDGIASLQTWQGIIKYAAAEQQAGDSGSRLGLLVKYGFSIDVAACGVGYGMSLIVLWSYFYWAGPEGVAHVHRALAFSYCTFILFNAVGTATAVVRIFDRFILIAAAQNFAAFVRLVCLTLMWILGQADVVVVATIWLISEIVGSVAIITFACVELKRRHIAPAGAPSLKKARYQFPELWSYVWTTGLSSTTRLTTQEFDAMLVGAVYGATGAGLYHLGKRVAVIVARLGEPLQQVVYPELARLWATGDRPGFRRVVFLSSAAAAAGSLIIITIILFLSDEIVVALAGHDYIAASSILSVHIFVYALYMSGVTLVPGLLAMGRQMDVLKIHLLGTGVFYIVVFPSLLAFGPAGASAAHISFNLVWLVASYVAFLVNSQRQPFGAPTGARLGP